MSIDRDRITLTQRATSQVRAEVWCGVEGPSNDLPVGAALEGPFSQRGRTLTSKFAFQRIEGGPLAGIWQAIIPEPVFWTPRMPAYYELRGVPGVRKRIGLRETFTRQESFYREERRWVARGAFATADQLHANLAEWNEADLVPIVGQSHLPLAEEAVGTGNPLIVDLTSDFTSENLTQLVPLASVMMAIVPHLASDFAPAVQFAKSCHLMVGVPATGKQDVPPDAQFVVACEGLIRNGWKPSRRLPVIVTRECETADRSPAELRGLCDQFQADLDRGAEYAGLWLLPKAST